MFWGVWLVLKFVSFTVSRRRRVVDSCSRRRITWRIFKAIFNLARDAARGPGLSPSKCTSRFPLFFRCRRTSLLAPVTRNGIEEVLWPCRGGVCCLDLLLSVRIKVFVVVVVVVPVRPGKKKSGRFSLRTLRCRCRHFWLERIENEATALNRVPWSAILWSLSTGMSSFLILSACASNILSSVGFDCGSDRPLYGFAVF